MSAEAGEDYLRHHLNIASVARMLLDETAVTAIPQGSGGLFRKANHLARGALIGGPLTTAWPLLQADQKNAEMKCRKARIEGTELYELEYRPKDGFGDMKVRMYFDIETFRHVRTEYRLRSRDDASLGGAAMYDPMGDPDQVKGQMQGTPAAPRGGGMAIGDVRRSAPRDPMEQVGLTSKPPPP